MANANVNKVVYGNTTLIDLTSDTVTADKLMQGYTAHDRSGAIITGTATGGGTGAISVVDTEDTHGGTIRTITAVDISDTTAVASDVAQGKYFYTADGTKTEGTSTGGGDAWTWMGKNPTKLRTCLNEKVYLKDTGYATWTPSTSSSSIVSPKDLTSFDVTVSEGDYILWYRFHAHFEYGSGATNNAKPTDYYWVRACILYGVRNSLSDMTNDTFSSSGMTGIAQYGGFDYYNSSGVLEYTPSALYTVYPSAWTFAQTSFSNNRLNISPVTATISARCNNTYFSTTNASAVDKDASYFEQVMEAWQVDVGTSVFGGEGNEVHDMWLDGYII